MYGKYDPKLEMRKVHKRTAGGQLGSKAELHDLLVSKGFSYIYEKPDASGIDLGIEKYESPLGAKAIMKRIEKGASARWLPPEQRKSGTLVKVRTAAMPDLWQLIMGKKRR